MTASRGSREGIGQLRLGDSERIFDRNALLDLSKGRSCACTIVRLLIENMRRDKGGPCRDMGGWLETGDHPARRHKRFLGYTGPRV